MSLLRHGRDCSISWHESCDCVVMPLTSRLANLVWNRVVFRFFERFYRYPPSAEELHRQRIAEQERARTQYQIDQRISEEDT